MPLVFISFINKTKLTGLVFKCLKTKLMKTNIFFVFIPKTKLTRLVFEWPEPKQIKTNAFFLL